MPEMVFFLVPDPRVTAPQGAAVIGSTMEEVRSWRFYLFHSQEQGMEFMTQVHPYEERDEQVQLLHASSLPKRSDREPELVTVGLPAASLVQTLFILTESFDSLGELVIGPCGMYPGNIDPGTAHMFFCWMEQDAQKQFASPRVMLFHSVEQYRSLAYKIPFEEDRLLYEESLRTVRFPERSLAQPSFIDGEMALLLWRGFELQRTGTDLDAVDREKMLQLEGRAVMQASGIDPGSYIVHGARGKA